MATNTLAHRIAAEQAYGRTAARRAEVAATTRRLVDAGELADRELWLEVAGLLEAGR
jgi:hypothetical protein